MLKNLRFLAPQTDLLIFHRSANTKPYVVGPLRWWKQGIPNYDWKKARGRKVLKIDLPEFHKNYDKDEITREEYRTKLKARGFAPVRDWNEKPIFMASSSFIYDMYVPPEGEGKASKLSKEGTKQSVQFLEKKARSFLSTRKIREYIESFDPSTFAQQAHDIYIKLHETIANPHSTDDQLFEIVTEKCYPEIMAFVRDKTVNWKFLKSLESPRIVSIRHQDYSQLGLRYAQVTVRFNTQQILAIYDKFGRLVHGSEVVAKDVLDYIVFENLISNVYGSWRIHGKIYAPNKSTSLI